MNLDVANLQPSCSSVKALSKFCQAKRFSFFFLFSFFSQISSLICFTPFLKGCLCWHQSGSVSEWPWTPSGRGQRQLSLLLSTAAAENENPASVRNESKFYEISETDAKK